MSGGGHGGQGKRRPALAILLLTALACGPAWAAAPDEAAQPVRQVVLDIVSFTRWPGARPELSLCVVGAATHAEAFFDGALQAGGVPVRPTRLGVDDGRLGTSCDIVYEAPLAATERDQVVRRIAGHPVLTIGEPMPGCIEVTMFCLQLLGPQIVFSTNLDAIARSGVRLNPRVLLLGRHPAGSGPQGGLQGGQQGGPLNGPGGAR